LVRVYELEDFTPTPETVHRLRAIIDEAFGRRGAAQKRGRCREEQKGPSL